MFIIHDHLLLILPNEFLKFPYSAYIVSVMAAARDVRVGTVACDHDSLRERTSCYTSELLIGCFKVILLHNLPDKVKVYFLP